MNTDFNGPYGLTEVDIFEWTAIKEIVPPLHARVQLLVYNTTSIDPKRLIAVYDASSITIADAYMPLGAPKEEQQTAAQWLLDLCCVRHGVEGLPVTDEETEIKIS